MGFIGWVIVQTVIGGIVGFLARAVLPGKQDIGLVKTVLLGAASMLIVSLILTSVSGLAALVVGVLVAVGLLWFGDKQGFLKA